MADDTQKVAVLRWRGMLAECSQPLRRMIGGLLALICITSVLTQTGYVGVQFADGSAVYLMFLLVPVAIAAVLLGALPATVTSFFVGTVLYLHSYFFPLDYYEIVYVTALSSIVLTGLCGFALGTLLSLALIEGAKGLRRVLLVTLACLVTSLVYSAGCTVLGVGHNAQATLSTVALAFQTMGNALIMATTSLATCAVTDFALRESNGAGLRTVFGAWLSVLAMTAFMVVGITSYDAITAREFNDAAIKVRDEVEFVLNQVNLMANYNGTGDENSLLTALYAGYTEDVDGLLVVAHHDVVMGTDVDRISEGSRLEDVFSKDMLDAAERSFANNTLERVVYVGPSVDSDLINFALPGTEHIFATMITSQVGYLMAMERNGYQVIIVRPVSMVFASRDDVIGWVFVSSLVLLVSSYMLSRWLLDQLVGRNVDMTNRALSRITAGDLEACVEPGATREFQELSEGINQTVGTLKGWIAEAESRMDSELATARVIQESALPKVYPPYPDIHHFDIFASMNAAREVGGDFYDFFLVGDDCGPDSGKLAFVLADVSGKGVPAALFMMKAKTQIHDYLESGMEVGEAVENANRRLCEGNEEGMFVTAWVGVLDYATRHIEFVNAGHNPPLLWQNGMWRWVKQKSGMPLGLFDEMPYMAFSLDCEVGDQLLAYTDGVTEAFSVDEEQYGDLRLEKLVNECFSLHPRELVDRVRSSVAAHAMGAEQSDDITILALEVGVPPEEKAQLVVPANVNELRHVVDFIHAELDRRLCPGRVQNQLDIAIEELFVNSCSYAYQGMDSSVVPYVRITHSYSANPASITVEIVDDGVPFNPLSKSDDEKIAITTSLLEVGIGGLGIMMAKKSVDEMRYERVGDSNVVTLVKRW